MKKRKSQSHLNNRSYKLVENILVVCTCILYFAYSPIRAAEDPTISLECECRLKPRSETLSSNVGLDFSALSNLSNSLPPSESVITSTILSINSSDIGNTSRLRENEILTKFANDSNIPIEQYINRKNLVNSSYVFKMLILKTLTKLKACYIQPPNLFDLQFNNNYWQTVQISGINFYLYGAYYDDRSLATGKLAEVRISSMIGTNKPPTAYCILWFKNFTTSAKATYIYGWKQQLSDNEVDDLQPYIISCSIPSIKKTRKDTEYLIPESVSLVAVACKSPMNNLKVINNRPEVKEEIAVCVKGLNYLYEDISVRLIEWIELLNILGAKKIFFYEFDVHSNVTKVLEYYRGKGQIEVNKISLPGNKPNLPALRHLYLKKQQTVKRLDEITPYNDCLYRNLYSYKYLVLLDIDEVIIPKKQPDWTYLLKQIEIDSQKEGNHSHACFKMSNAFFLIDERLDHLLIETEIPKDSFLLRNIFRWKNYSEPNVPAKCIHNVDRIESLNSHFPVECFGSCTSYSVSRNFAQLQHYRNQNINAIIPDLDINIVKDTTIWRYKNDLINRTDNILTTFGYF